jgi:hypothetical protein
MEPKMQKLNNGIALFALQTLTSIWGFTDSMIFVSISP